MECGVGELINEEAAVSTGRGLYHLGWGIKSIGGILRKSGETAVISVTTESTSRINIDINAGNVADRSYSPHDRGHANR
jgi:hypothetical protein